MIYVYILILRVCEVFFLMLSQLKIYIYIADRNDQMSDSASDNDS